MTKRLPFQKLLHRGVEEGATPLAGLLYFTLDPYLILLSVKQGDIKYHFMSLWYESTWDCTQVSRAIDKHSNHSMSSIIPKNILVRNETGKKVDYGFVYISLLISILFGILLKIIDFNLLLINLTF